jgi:hypothetical protein
MGDDPFLDAVQANPTGRREFLELSLRAAGAVAIAGSVLGVGTTVAGAAEPAAGAPDAGVRQGRQLLETGVVVDERGRRWRYLPCSGKSELLAPGERGVLVEVDVVQVPF